ncbi:OLC1v1020472C1 [Oldenlandia corymbosa var. corymbosa]|uniref:SKP1-like protein n=1 Tax=Oldenlandia corymbosa var. corymbosa TaxID=529605 RepID=A0AAV1EGI3_OLDCO|nr:OLC1v1020472C1 [Oldenlandia corymbosa var. corymbosa]
MSTASSSKETIVLRSCDGEEFKVGKSVAAGSKTIKHMIEDDCVSETIPVPNVTGEILSKVVGYLNRHHHASVIISEAAEDDTKIEEEEALEDFDSEFVKVDRKTLYDLIMAANYLDINDLLDLTCKSVADIIKSHNNVDDIRADLNF